MSSNSNLDLRRHQELFDADKFDKPVTVLGAGASASWLVSMLARLGITNITVWDFDKVEEHNVPNQAFGIKQVGMYKVDALKENILRDTGLEINTVNDRFTNQRLNGYVFCMIDTMSGRKSIWEQAVKMKSAINLYVEPRMGLDMGRVYNVEPLNLKHIKEYENTFYSDEEAEVSACGTSMSVVTTASGIASYCARQLINHFNKEELDNEILIDFKYNNIIASRW